jgi:hypothetical protein
MCSGQYLYGITNAGELYWYQHLGQSTGTPVWANGGNPQTVGSGWNIFKQVLASAGGYLYGIPNNGDLYWYQHLGQGAGTPVWANGGNPQTVGSGWNFTNVLSGDTGFLYGITP